MSASYYETGYGPWWYFFYWRTLLVDGNSYMLTLTTEVVMIPTLSPLVAPLVVITTVYGAKNDEKVDNSRFSMEAREWCRAIQLQWLYISQSKIMHTATLFRQKNYLKKEELEINDLAFGEFKSSFCCSRYILSPRSFATTRTHFLLKKLKMNWSSQANFNEAFL